MSRKPKGTRPRGSLEERFWAKVQKGPGCWLWTGARTSSGRYGNIRRGPAGEGCVGAHVVSHELHHGPVPPGLDVMHSCDVGICVNPDHLSSGTRQENLIDAVDKGRHRGPFKVAA